MPKRISIVLLGFAAAMAFPALAVAESNLTVRGGYGTSLTGYYYSLDVVTAKRIHRIMVRGSMVTWHLPTMPCLVQLVVK